MAGLLMGVLGGALQGVGEGMQEQAKMEGLMKREARLAELKHGYDKEMAGVRYGYDEKLEGVRSANRDAENAASSQRGLLNAKELAKYNQGLDLEKSAAGQAFEREKLGIGHQNELDKIRAQTEAKVHENKIQKPLTTNEYFNAVVDRNSTYEKIDGSIEVRKTTNWEGVKNDFRRDGREDLARIAGGSPDPTAWEAPKIPDDLQPGGARPPSPVVTAPLTIKDALDLARNDAAVMLKGGVSPKDAFPETGGNQDAWIIGRAAQHFGRAAPWEKGGAASGGTGPAAGTASAPATPPPAPQSAAPAQAGSPQGGPVRERFVRGPDGKMVSESKLRGTP